MSLLSPLIRYYTSCLRCLTGHISKLSLHICQHGAQTANKHAHFKQHSAACYRVWQMSGSDLDVLRNLTRLLFLSRKQVEFIGLNKARLIEGRVLLFDCVFKISPCCCVVVSVPFCKDLAVISWLRVGIKMNNMQKEVGIFGHFSIWFGIIQSTGCVTMRWYILSCLQSAP